jgi:hypothetical protein
LESNSPTHSQPEIRRADEPEAALGSLPVIVTSLIGLRYLFMHEKIRGRERNSPLYSHPARTLPVDDKVLCRMFYKSRSDYAVSEDGQWLALSQSDGVDLSVSYFSGYKNWARELTRSI